MRHLGKLVAVAVATLALVTPATVAQADPGINSNLSDGSVTFRGKTTCSWTNVATNANPPSTVTVSAADATNAISCTNGYWGVVNADLVVTFNGNDATIALVDVTGGALFFWCRYRATNVTLSGGNPYTGTFVVPLYDSNWSSQCSNPATVDASVTFH